jgi:hypothetical protein
MTLQFLAPSADEGTMMTVPSRRPVLYEQCDIPPGMTLDAWRRSRPRPAPRPRRWSPLRALRTLRR